jgi:hypothetical protein
MKAAFSICRTGDAKVKAPATVRGRYMCLKQYVPQFADILDSQEGTGSPLYRIAETSFGVAMREGGIGLARGDEFEDGVGGAIDRAWGTQAAAGLGQIAAEGFAGALVV